MIDEKIEELIAIGASVSANCHPCVKFHMDKAKRLDIAPEDLKAALKVGAMVRGGAAVQMDKFLSAITVKNGIDYKGQADSNQGCK